MNIGELMNRELTKDEKDTMEWEAEKRERRHLWEEQKKWEAEEQERQQKQARMEAWLKSRGQAWMDHTGSVPPASMIETWQAEYIAERAAEEELDRELRLAQAEDIAGS